MQILFCFIFFFWSAVDCSLFQNLFAALVRLAGTASVSSFMSDTVICQDCGGCHECMCKKKPAFPNKRKKIFLFRSILSQLFQLPILCTCAVCCRERMCKKNMLFQISERKFFYFEVFSHSPFSYPSSAHVLSAVASCVSQL